MGFVGIVMHDCVCVLEQKSIFEGRGACAAA